MTSNKKLLVVTLIPLPPSISLRSLVVYPNIYPKTPPCEKDDLSPPIHISISREQSGCRDRKHPNGRGKEVAWLQ